MDETNDSDESFGRRVHDELKRLGGYTELTSLLNYQGIQKLKAATREEMLEMFKGSEYLLLQQIRNSTPEELAAILSRRAMMARLAWVIALQ